MSAVSPETVTAQDEVTELLVDLIRGGSPEPQHITLPTELVVRQSCRPLT